MKHNKNVIKFIVLLLVLCASFVPTFPAQAAFNGQQLAVYTCQANRVLLMGYNQWGQSASYAFTKSSTSCSWTYIYGWWWKGNVKIYTYYYLSPTYTSSLQRLNTVYVPTAQTSDWVYAYVLTSVRDVMMWKAQTWVNDGVSYSQTSYRDGYRKDCSGYVSFAWGTAKPGFTTGTWDTNAYPISFDSLQPGDALNSVNGGHMLLFKRWVNKSAGIFDAYEENPAHRGAHITPNITLNKNTGQLSVTGYTYPGWYFAIRKKGL